MFTPSVFSITLALIIGISLIILLSSRYKMHPFFSLIIACFITGWMGGLETNGLLNTMKEGFGKIMSALGFIIVLGTALGLVLQANGATTVMANTILKWVGARRSVFAISLTGFIVGLPIFCDSGYIVLNGLNKSLIRKTATPTIIMSTALATGLYAVHCFVPPHPGITAAAGTIHADLGQLILYGLLVAIPAMLAGYYWALRKGKNFPEITKDQYDPEPPTTTEKTPGALGAFIPVIVPILLIAVKALLGSLEIHISAPILLMGDPAVALAIGLICALLIPKKWKTDELSGLMHHGIEKAGGILIIIGAGSALGAVIGALKIQEHLSGLESLNALGVFFPFLIAAILKTAQGSSTVAILTSASIVLPFLNGLQLDSPNGHVIVVLAMGAGSMTVSHVNDSYFWVIANFSDLELKPMLKVYTTATLIMGVIGILSVYLLSLILL